MTDHNTQETRNRAVLVGLNADSLPREDNASETTLEELAALVETAGGESVGIILQNRDTPEARTFIGEGDRRPSHRPGGSDLRHLRPAGPHQRGPLTGGAGPI